MKVNIKPKRRPLLYPPPKTPPTPPFTSPNPCTNPRLANRICRLGRSRRDRRAVFSRNMPASGNAGVPAGTKIRPISLIRRINQFTYSAFKTGKGAVGAAPFPLILFRLYVGWSRFRSGRGSLFCQVQGLRAVVLEGGCFGHKVEACAC